MTRTRCRYLESTDHDKPHFYLFFTTEYQRQKKFTCLSWVKAFCSVASYAMLRQVILRVLHVLLKNWFMLSVRISSYGCTREVWRAQIDVSFLCVCSVIYHKFRHHIVKVAVDPQGDSRVDLSAY